MQDWVKTQFAPLDIHVQIIELFQKLRPELKRLTIDDEGELWETGDRDKLAAHLAYCFAAMKEQQATRADLEGPIRLPSGRIIDLASRKTG